MKFNYPKVPACSSSTKLTNLCLTTEAALWAYGHGITANIQLLQPTSVE